MKKILRVLFVSLFLITSVNAKTIEESRRENKNILENHVFSFKYTNLDTMVEKNYNWLKANEYDGSNYEKEFLNNKFFEYLFRDDLYNIFDFENVLGMDTACYRKGDNYYYGNTMQIADKDFCEVMVYYGTSFENEVHDKYTLDVTYEEVSGNENITKKVDLITNELFGTFNVADKDMINHLINYESDTTTFFSPKRSLKEFAQVKNVVEKNPDFDFSISFEETRRGISLTGIADGFTFVKYNGIYYGFTFNGFYQSNMFYVPVGTDVKDYAKVLEDSLKKYINNPDINVKVESDFSIEEWENEALPVEEVLFLTMGINTKKYYELVNTNFEKEYEKLKSGSSNENIINYYKDKDELITTLPYVLTVNDKKYCIGILQMPEEYSSKFGVISSVDTKTGIILKTKASNVPLDAKLISDNYKLSDEEINILTKKGYKTVDGYSLKLYSDILDKIISNFNDVTEVLIPYDKSSDGLVMLYINDDGSIEKYKVEQTNVDGVKYLSFKTNHFSNYILASDNLSNPNTLDNITVYFTTFTLSILAIGYIITKLRKNN